MSYNQPPMMYGSAHTGGYPPYYHHEPGYSLFEKFLIFLFIALVIGGGFLIYLENQRHLGLDPYPNIPEVPIFKPTIKGTKTATTSSGSEESGSGLGAGWIVLIIFALILVLIVILFESENVRKKMRDTADRINDIKYMHPRLKGVFSDSFSYLGRDNGLSASKLADLYYGGKESMGKARKNMGKKIKKATLEVSKQLKNWARDGKGDKGDKDAEK